MSWRSSTYVFDIFALIIFQVKIFGEHCRFIALLTFQMGTAALLGLSLVNQDGALRHLALDAVVEQDLGQDLDLLESEVLRGDLLSDLYNLPYVFLGVLVLMQQFQELVFHGLLVLHNLLQNLLLVDALGARDRLVFYLEILIFSGQLQITFENACLLLQLESALTLTFETPILNCLKDGEPFVAIGREVCILSDAQAAGLRSLAV